MEIQKIKIEKISASPLNPRKTFDEVAIEELAANIEKQGLLQPITVRPTSEAPYLDEDTGEVINVKDTYEIVCGERRFRALQRLKAKEDEANIAKIKAHRKKTELYQTISCIVREMTDDEAFDAMITENLQRKDVDPIEEAFAFSQLMEKGRTLEDIALRFGKSTRFVFDRVKLNSLIPELKARVRDGEIPISGAMILSKLDDIEQARFHKDNEGQCNVIMIRRFVSNSFMELDRADWIKDNADIWDDGTFKSCAECEFSTANHGCLFYEMNSEKANCTNPVCYKKKQLAYVLRRIQAENGILVKNGEPLVFGKTVIVDDGPQSYWSEEKKTMHDNTLEAIKQLGYCIVNPNEAFRSKCWYDEEDERLQKMLDDSEIYRCISCFDYCGPEFKVQYYYIRKDVASTTSALADPKEIEKEKVRAQLKRAKEIVVEKTAETLRTWAQEKPYHERKVELTTNEQLVFDVMVLSHCKSSFLKSLGLDKYDKKSDFMKYIENNQADRAQWYRAFIAESLSDNNVNFYPYLQKCQNLLFSEQYPDEYLELSKKLGASFEKKQKKHNAQLKALDNTNTEEA